MFDACCSFFLGSTQQGVTWGSFLRIFCAQCVDRDATHGRRGHRCRR